MTIINIKNYGLVLYVEHILIAFSIDMIGQISSEEFMKFPENKIGQ